VRLSDPALEDVFRVMELDFMKITGQNSLSILTIILSQVS